VRWLVDGYLAYLQKRIDAGLNSPATLRQRRSLLLRFCAMTDDDGDAYGSLSMDIPPAALVKARDAWMDRPAEADNLMKAIRAMFVWAVDTGAAAVNPGKGVGRIHRSGGGAVPWTAADLRKFRDHHPVGTTAHAWLTLTMFVACRIGDSYQLGRRHEVDRAGQLWLCWQPQKKGSAFVEVPMLPPLIKALRALKVEGAAYLLTSHGRPFASKDVLGNSVRTWCDAAGLPDRSSHGVRKAMAELLAEAGCSQHQIMAILSHTQAKTSEIYTMGAQRRILAADAMQAIAGIEW
jgi:integrase